MGPRRIQPVRAIPTRQARPESSLLEMSNALSGALRVRNRVQQAPGILERHHGALRSTMTLVREGSHDPHIEASVGLSSDGQRARELIGEGVTGRVVETGKPVVRKKRLARGQGFEPAACRLTAVEVRTLSALNGCSMSCSKSCPAGEEEPVRPASRLKMEASQLAASSAFPSNHRNGVISCIRRLLSTSYVTPSAAARYGSAVESRHAMVRPAERVLPKRARRK